MQSSTSAKQQKISVFPDYDEIEYERSELIMPLYNNGNLIEELKLDAYLKLQRYKPTEVCNIRSFEFEILRWDVIGESSFLNGTIGFSLSEVPQPRSVCIADNDDGDYPATIVYNAIYDIFFNSNKIIEKRAGLGVGKGVTEIPPRGISVSFQKPFSTDKFTVLAGECKAMISMPELEWTKAADNVVKRLFGQQ